MIGGVSLLNCNRSLTCLVCSFQFSGDVIARKDCAKLASKYRNGDSMNAVITREFIDVRNCGGNRRPSFYKKDILEILWRQV